MLRKIWIVAVVACACVALTPDSAEAGRRKKKGNDCCCQQQTCCNTCNTCNSGSSCNSCSSCSSCGGGMVGGMVTTPTAPPPVATK